MTRCHAFGDGHMDQVRPGLSRDPVLSLRRQTGCAPAQPATVGSQSEGVSMLSQPTPREDTPAAAVRGPTPNPRTWPLGPPVG